MQTQKKTLDTQGREIKFFTFDKSQEGFEVKQADRAGLPLGIIKGFLATYGNIDRVDDRIEKGAFTETLKRHREQKRMIRMLFQHSRFEMIGGFPIELVEDQDKGLFVVGEINLDVQRGRETFALIKQGALSDMSIGFSIIKAGNDKDDVRVLEELELWEGSVVDEPANTEAVITQIKNLTSADIENIKTTREFEKILCDAGFERNAAKKLISRIKGKKRDAGLQKEERDAGPQAPPLSATELAGIESLAFSLKHL